MSPRERVPRSSSGGARAVLFTALAVAAVLCGCAAAWADDCTDTGDCAMAPRNIDGATAIAAALPFAYFGWRYLSGRGGAGGAALRAPGAPMPPGELAAAVDEVKADFERLQRELRLEAAAQIAALRDVNRRYDEKWKEAMGELEDYMRAYPDLLPGLNAIWEQFGSREWARQVAEWCDVALQVATAGAGIARAGLGAASAARAGEEAVEAMGRRALRETTEEGAELAARRAAAEAVEETAEAAALRAEREAAEAARRDVAAAERRLADAQAEASRRQAERAAIEARARADAERAAEVANRAERAGAEDRLLHEIRDVNGPGPGAPGRNINCMDCARAVDDTLAGRPRVAPPRFGDGYHAELEAAYNRRFATIADKAELDDVLASAPPGARGIVRIGWAGEDYGHAFNAVNRNGRVFYPDGQQGNMFDAWDDVGEIIFMWTHLP